ncbi:dihydrolipoyllysine-residue acetyltransferase [Pseudomonas sp. PB101]|uniref:dihydrolipoyllysine-residue acetyltransferase n=1 Tax=Pseudomonas sp. PB101 TaxID=2495428 RepID=UPI00136522FE|nr:dihydrolipoyllysine-residue acetyltransferase [Pseudomonas sp. PB101]MVW84813.1 dihydrolipoyllysine-residue acetyltransferase [Pseudomonas sp. PB101]
MSVIEVKVPDIGDFHDVPVVEIQVRVGDRIEKDQPVLSLESDKALIDVPAPASGIVSQLNVAVGDKVSQGTLLLHLELVEAGAEGAPPVLPVQQAEMATNSNADISHLTPPIAPPIALPAVASESFRHSSGYAGPAMRKFARELGVDVAVLSGSGQRGRVTRLDILNHVKTGLTSENVSRPAANSEFNLIAWPKIDFSRFGQVRAQPLSRIKKISGANLHRNWVRIPHVTNHDEVDVTELEKLRLQLNSEYSKAGIKITFLAFLIKACAAALKRFPIFNTSLEGEDLIYKEYVHIGFAADTPNGLVVPVIRDVDQKGVLQICQEMGNLSALAREGKLKPEQMQGGCFSISSLGGIGGTYFTPIINAPEVAILGVGKAVIKPTWMGSIEQGEVHPRLMMPLSLSWDHRVVDGAEAGRFLAFINQVSVDFRRILL